MSSFDHDKFIEEMIHRLLIVRKALLSETASPKSVVSISGELVNLEPFTDRNRIFSCNLHQKDGDAVFFFLMDMCKACLSYNSEELLTVSEAIIKHLS